MAALQHFAAGFWCKLSFEVSAKDEIEPICSGTYGCFVVDVGKTI